jgi:hypothetical protein
MLFFTPAVAPSGASFYTGTVAGFKGSSQHVLAGVRGAVHGTNGHPRAALRHIT